MRGKFLEIVEKMICIGVAIPLSISGCANTTSNLQNDVASEEVSHASEAQSLDSSCKEAVISDISKETLDENSSGDEVPSALIPAVMVDGTIYYLSQGPNLSDQEITSDPIGYTESEVPLDTYPEKDGESNYAPAGTAYVKYENGYALKIDKYGWTLFLTWEERLLAE